MEIATVIRKFEELENARNVEGMRRFGIVCSGKMYGVNIPVIRRLAKEIKTDHTMALELWQMDVHEAKILATMIADVVKLSEDLIEGWVLDLYSWDICDQLIMNYFEKYPFAQRKALEWSERNEEFVRRAGFVLMARLAMRKFRYTNKEYQIFYKKIKEAATDP